MEAIIAAFMCAIFAIFGYWKGYRDAMHFATMQLYEKRGNLK